MYRRRRKQLLIETYELVIVNYSSADNSECEICPDNSQMVSPETGSRLTGVTQREIFRYIESGAVHFSENRGSLLVCLCSLTAAVETLWGEQKIKREKLESP